MNVTGSLLVCCAAACFTAGALIVNDDASGGSPGPAPAAASPGVNGTSTQTAQIDIQGFAFSTIRVAPGATVLVANHDRVAHTASATGGAFDSGTIPGGQAISFIAPKTPGSYQFVCAIHPSMHGQLIVA